MQQICDEEGDEGGILPDAPGSEPEEASEGVNRKTPERRRRVLVGQRPLVAGAASDSKGDDKENDEGQEGSR